MKHSPSLLALPLVILAACGGPPGASDDDDDAIDAASVIDASLPDAAVPDAAPPDAIPGPDLTVNAARAKVDLAIEVEYFAPDSCELDPVEACVNGSGDRRLLRFATESPNIGDADLFLGTPSPENPAYIYSECHGHYHFNGYAAYSLEDSEGNIVAPGHKQAFCLLDWQRIDFDDPTVNDESTYHCAYQGIQRGWSDVYEARLPCQFIDITDVADGEYTLKIEINSERAIYEMSYENNIVTMPVTIGDPTLEDPTEDCPTGMLPRDINGRHRECGWDLLGTWDCTPDALFRIGCSEACSGLGSCTGDPMVRVCDNADPDGNCTATTNMGDNDDSCGSQCARVKNLTCPASGKVDLYAAPLRHGEAYTCNVELELQ